MVNARPLALGAGIVTALALPLIAVAPAHAVVLPDDEASLSVSKVVVDEYDEVIDPASWLPSWGFLIEVGPAIGEQETTVLLRTDRPGFEWTGLTGGTEYTISEASDDVRFEAAGIECFTPGLEIEDADPEAPGFQLVPTESGEYHCMVTNVAKSSTVTVDITAIGGDADFGFVLDGGVEPVGHEVTTSAGAGQTVYSGLAAAAEYSLGEAAIPAGWVSNGLSCSGEGDEGPVELDPDGFAIDADEHVACAVTYTKQAAAAAVPEKPELAATGVGPIPALLSGLALLAAGGVAMLRRRRAGRLG